MLKRGTKSVEVQELQEKLVTLGYNVIVNGDFGFLTEIVVRDFQRHSGLIEDGIVGPNTKDKLVGFAPETFCPEVFETVTGFENHTAAAIESTLQKGLKGLGKTFYLAGLNNQIKWTHIVAHAILESASGTSKIARTKNNLFGWRAYDKAPFVSAKSFESFADCIYQWSAWFKKVYLDPNGKYFNGDSEFGVNIKYATSPIAGVNKSFLVRKVRKKANEYQERQMDRMINQKIARLLQKLSEVEQALTQIHRVLDEFRIWLRELADQERATHEIEQNPELSASLERGVQDIREGHILTHEEVFGTKGDENVL